MEGVKTVLALRSKYGQPRKALSDHLPTTTRASTRGDETLTRAEFPTDKRNVNTPRAFRYSASAEASAEVLQHGCAQDGGRADAAGLKLRITGIGELPIYNFDVQEKGFPLGDEVARRDPRGGRAALRLPRVQLSVGAPLKNAID